jgi:hypothetical protein
MQMDKKVENGLDWYYSGYKWKSIITSDYDAEKIKSLTLSACWLKHVL